MCHNFYILLSKWALFLFTRFCVKQTDPANLIHMSLSKHFKTFRVNKLFEVYVSFLYFSSYICFSMYISLCECPFIYIPSGCMFLLYKSLYVYLPPSVCPFKYMSPCIYVTLYIWSFMYIFCLFIYPVRVCPFHVYISLYGCLFRVYVSWFGCSICSIGYISSCLLSVCYVTIFSSVVYLLTLGKTIQKVWHRRAVDALDDTLTPLLTNNLQSKFI